MSCLTAAEPLSHTEHTADLPHARAFCQMLGANSKMFGDASSSSSGRARRSGMTRFESANSLAFSDAVSALPRAESLAGQAEDEPGPRVEEVSPQAKAQAFPRSFKTDDALG